MELFSGSLQEYQILKGREYEIIDTNRQDKSVYFDLCSSQNGGTVIFSHNPDIMFLGKMWADAVIRFEIIEFAGYKDRGIPVRERQKQISDNYRCTS